MTDDHARNAKIAANERLIREANWELSLESAAAGSEDELEFLCACGRPDCQERLLLTIEEYRAAHSQPHRFVVVPDHVDGALERVVDDHRHYVVIEKRPEYQGADPTSPP